MPAYMQLEDEDVSGSGTGSISGNTSWYPLRLCPADLSLAISVTSLTGTSPALWAWLQGSNDEGTTVFDIPAALVVKTASGTAGGSVSANQRNIVDNETGTGTSVYFASYPGLAVKKVRVAYIAEGTSPSVAFSVQGLPS